MVAYEVDGRMERISLEMMDNMVTDASDFAKSNVNLYG